MRLEFTAAGGELFIHLDAAGLAELMRAIQQAMGKGVGRLKAGAGPGSFGAVTVTFAAPGGPDPP
jgi:hypothetical protein